MKDGVEAEMACPMPELQAQLAGKLLQPGTVAQVLAPLFQKTCTAGQMYLATHSMGLPPDSAEDHLQKYLVSWRRGAEAWPDWLAAREHYRLCLAALLGAPRVDCVVPRESAGAALASVLGMLPPGARVVASAGEFSSVLTVLGRYAARGRIQLTVLPEGEITSALARELASTPIALVVLSHVFYATGELLPAPRALADLCHAHGAALLLDAYHSLGVLPVSVRALACDYMIGGCYKYLRGGPGAAFLYIAPAQLEETAPLDAGWFALAPGAEVQPGFAPPLASGGDAHLGGTPAVAAWYAARAGLELALTITPERLRAWSLTQLRILKDQLAEQDVQAEGADERHGAFLTVAVEQGDRVVAALAERNIVANVRRGRLRLTPDLLSTTDELRSVARALGELLRA